MSWPGAAGTAPPVSPLRISSAAEFSAPACSPASPHLRPSAAPVSVFWLRQPNDNRRYNQLCSAGCGSYRRVEMSCDSCRRSCGGPALRWIVSQLCWQWRASRVTQRQRRGKGQEPTAVEPLPLYWRLKLLTRRAAWVNLCRSISLHGLGIDWERHWLPAGRCRL
ncbi:uncharacterized protein LOC122392753 [Amphibalanus amphitrite]|uniref:uncharacterized protein LOC122392753 n=1 Tax=Amphibalanus amphitrite TaxID=1232801 RepID=UPI001C8FE0E7|nr:uncharacterized protein LOC122392753 [Amphibalanus amphitrite]